MICSVRIHEFRGPKASDKASGMTGTTVNLTMRSLDD
jgi:hypothetical protein